MVTATVKVGEQVITEDQLKTAHLVVSQLNLSGPTKDKVMDELNKLMIHVKRIKLF